ncbi:hypothetical protein [Flagellimonas olearia]|uniref:Uncharacterized protein n=1 Tax=Flagellimonas olearia TaxID=552546 RepID=A0A444VI40_9FLAO|nr:hypothetical protein [Allomuricauda olearia]RYC50436.1 hypothetical protein DN53_05835 [Allomuricauda olearia]
MEVKQVDRFLKKPKYSKVDLDLSYRIINHYKTFGLIDGNFNSGKWLKVNSYQFIWIQIIVKLRTWGVSLKKISLLKENLFTKSHVGSIDLASYINKSFEEEIIQAIINKNDLYLLVFMDMTYSFQDSSNKGQWANRAYKDVGHINIPLSRVISKVYRDLENA